MKRIITLILAVVLISLLVAHVDAPALAAHLRKTHLGWLAVALLLFIPQIATIAWRWKQMVSVFSPLALPESVRLILASQSMNLLLPSKMGDLSKGYFLARGGALDLPRAMSIVVFEKMLDVATLAAFMLGGLALLMVRQASHSLVHGSALFAATGIGVFAVGVVALLYFVPLHAIPLSAKPLDWLAVRPQLRKVHTLLTGSHEVLAMLQSRGARRGEILSLSALIWMWHLVQIYCFFRAVGNAPGAGEFASMVPLAIFVGLLPLTIAGFGTRDAALVAFFPQFPEASMLAAAFFVNLRYLLPAAVGIAFLKQYIIKSPQDATR